MNKIQKPKISSEEYGNILKGLRFERIELVKSSCHVQKKNCSKNMSNITIGEGCNFKLSRNKKKSNVLIIQKYCLIIGAKKKYFVKIECEFNLLLQSKEKFTKDFFKTYKNISLPGISWPFFREFVYSNTARMYLPPLVLPFKRIVASKN